MASLYFVITLGFIAAFFRQDQREWPQFTFSLWIPLVWIVSHTTRLTQILFPIGGFSNAPSFERSMEGNPISRMIAIMLLLMGIYILAKRKRAFLELAHASQGIIVLYAYILLTIAWSDYPDVSIKRFIRLCGSLIIAFIVASEEEHHKALEHILRRYIAIFLILSMYFIRTDRSIGYVIGVHGAHFMAGIASHKNELGIICMFSIVFLLNRAIRQWPSVNIFDGILILINAYFLIRVRSTTALVLSLFGMTLIVLMKMAHRNLRSASILILFLIIVILPILLITMNSPVSTISGAFFEATGKDATISGRTTLWGDLIRLGKKDIILGSGYESYWFNNYREIWALWSFLPTNAHNGFVEVLLNLGLIGLAITIIVILRTIFFVGSENYLFQPSTHWCFVVLTMFIIGNLTEASLVNMTLNWSLFLLISVNAEKDRMIRFPNGHRVASESG